jgi:hypothetical protein
MADNLYRQLDGRPALRFVASSRIRSTPSGRRSSTPTRTSTGIPPGRRSTCALAVVLGASALIMDRRMISTALLAYLTFAAYHLVFHVTHLERFPQADAIAQTAVLSLGSPSRWCS